MTKDYLKTLHLNHDASPQQIKRAYRRLIQRYHPDKYTGNKQVAENITIKLNQAYAVLSGKIRRQINAARATKKRVKKYIRDFPMLAQEWHPTLNGSLTPDNVTHGSGKLIWWVCRRGHEYQRTVKSRTRNVFYFDGKWYNGGAGCTVCKKLTMFQEIKIDLGISLRRPRTVVFILTLALHFLMWQL